MLFKFLNHWLYHGQDIKRKDSISSSDGYEQLDKHQGCLRSLTECALFLPRDDLAYEIQKIRKEIEERRARYFCSVLYNNFIEELAKPNISDGSIHEKNFCTFLSGMS